MNTTRPIGPILASVLILAGLVPFAPAASAQVCDLQDVPPGDSDAWIRASNPVADDAGVSELLRLHLFDQGGPLNVADEVNGIDAYVHDLGCEVTNGGLDWCVTGLQADRSSSTILIGSSQQVLQLSGRDDDFKVAFFTEGPVHNQIGHVRTVDRDTTTAAEGCEPSDTSDGDGADALPKDTRFVVIWLDSGSTVNDTPGDLDHAHNLIPRGYQFRDDPLYGTYNVHFEFEVCTPQESNC